MKIEKSKIAEYLIKKREEVINNDKSYSDSAIAFALIIIANLKK